MRCQVTRILDGRMGESEIRMEVQMGTGVADLVEKRMISLRKVRAKAVMNY